jgi:hypothetical protein
MRHLPIALIAIAWAGLLAPVASAASDILLAAFEGPTYAGWKGPRLGLGQLGEPFRGR